jgi:hypothetical protein
VSLLDDFRSRGVFRTGDGVTRQIEDVDYLVPDDDLPPEVHNPRAWGKRRDNMWQHRRPGKKKSDG